MKQEITSPQFGVLQEMKYQNTNVLAGNFPPGEMIAIRSICDNLGIDRKWQQEKIQNDPILGPTGGMAKVISSDGKTRDMYCLPPASLQSWLWNLTATDNINKQLWEEYKKGLVLHLLLMLKISLDEVVRLRNFESRYNKLKSEFVEYVNETEKGKSLNRQAKEMWKSSNERKEKILDILNEDDSQLVLAL